MSCPEKDYASAAFAPDFFLVGAARCGTTAVHSWLKPHPAIRMTDPDKEPGYYCDFWGTPSFSEYRRNFDGAAPEQLRGDASTHYMTAPNSPAILHRANPDAKIIISLRNPADRAYSLFRFMQCEGYEPLEGFEDALAAEAERAERFLPPHSEAITYPYNFLYFRSGCYHPQLRRYLDAFPREQVLVLVFEEMIRNPRETYSRLMAHLGLPDEPDPPPLPRENRSWHPRSLKVQNLLKQRIVPLCRRLRVPHHPVYSTLSRWNRDDAAAPGLNPATRERLQRAYDEDIARTEELLGRPLDVWRK